MDARHRHGDSAGIVADARLDAMGGLLGGIKQTIILAYTAAIFAVGRYTSALALRRTGTTLLALSVMLAPVACAALPWLWEAQAWNVTYFALLAAGGALALVVGWSGFRHFLHRSNLTLTASYVTLSLAGAIVPVSETLRSPWVAAALWMVFAAGTIKTNRQIFWLLEERRQPRAFGFLPMMLLGAVFERVRRLLRRGFLACLDGPRVRADCRPDPGIGRRGRSRVSAADGRLGPPVAVVDSDAAGLGPRVVRGWRLPFGSWLVRRASTLCSRSHGSGGCGVDGHCRATHTAAGVRLGDARVVDGGVSFSSRLLRRDRASDHRLFRHGDS